MFTSARRQRVPHSIFSLVASGLLIAAALFSAPANAQGNLTITPAEVIFGTQPIGTTTPDSFVTLGNTGTAALTVSDLTLATPPFNRTTAGTCGNSLPITIAVGASCTLSYSYSATEAVLSNQTFTVTSNASGATTYTLSGTGVFIDAIFANGFEAGTLTITTTSLTGGVVGSAYSATVAASGGTTPYAWSVSIGSLPPDLTINAATGEITGTPSSAGSFTFTLQVTDASSPMQTAARQFTISIVQLVEITITPANPAIANGTTQQFTATGTYSDGSTQDLTSSVTWASSNNAVATISNALVSKGLASGVGAGSTTISATLNAVSGSTTLMVTL